MTKVRWSICGLLFFATTINYLDRQTFSILVPFFENDLRLGPVDLALINVSFLLAYGFGMPFAGRWIDRIGVRKGLGSSFLLWNLASMGHALVASLGGFVAIRFLLGVGESGNFPASVRTVSEWFPRRERALAVGWFNAGSNVGAILAPVLAVAIAQAYGWRACFFGLGAVGLVWWFFWRRLYQKPSEHPLVSAEELAYITQDPDESVETVSLDQLFGMKPIYALGFAKFLTDAPWWFYLTWLPKFLTDEFHLSTAFMAFSLPVVFIVADLGSVGGGWLSSWLLSRGASVGRARKLAMLTCALAAVPVMLVGSLVAKSSAVGLPAIYPALAILSLAAAAHQGWSSNLYALVSDTLPRPAVATAVGVNTAFGVTGGALFQIFVGNSVAGGSYTLPFVVAGSLYLVGLLVLQLMLPQVTMNQSKGRVSMGWVALGGVALIGAVIAFQVVLNKPKYVSLADYETKRGVELKAVQQPISGPTAKVGWMDARWISWKTPAGQKVELVKMDRDGRPSLEPKGQKAKGYQGPTFP